MKDQLGGALDLAVEGTKQILPDAEGVFDAIGRIGYEFEQAIADLVDNSIDAGATNVLIRFLYDDKSVRSVAVIDDGRGMDATTIDRAMSFGARSGKAADELGRYGMGLKSATFSQCEVLTVVASQAGRVEGRRWTAERARADWTCEVLRSAPSADYLRAHSDRVNAVPAGTLVQWDRLDKVSHSMQAPEQMLNARFEQLSSHLGLVFHRFIEQARVRIRMDARHVMSEENGFAQTIEPLNPFPRTSGAPDYPLAFNVELPTGVSTTFVAHIWRRNSSEPGFRLGAGRLAKKQGIYVYRNDRVIQAGGWNGLRNDSEVHSSLARVEFNLPTGQDALFKPTVQKSAVSMPEAVLQSFRKAHAGSRTFADYIADAEQAYRDQKPERHIRHGLVPVGGLTKDLARRFERILGEVSDDEDTVRFEWVRMDPEIFVRLEPQENLISLNSRYRDLVLYGTRGSSGDAPLVKTLLMLLFKDDLARRYRMTSNEARIELINRLLIEAIKAQA